MCISAFVSLCSSFSLIKISETLSLSTSLCTFSLYCTFLVFFSHTPSLFTHTHTHFTNFITSTHRLFLSLSLPFSLSLFEAFVYWFILLTVAKPSSLCDCLYLNGSRFCPPETMKISGKSLHALPNHTLDSDLQPAKPFHRRPRTPRTRLRRLGTPNGKRSRPETPLLKWKIHERNDGGDDDPLEEDRKSVAGDGRRTCRRKSQTVSARKLAAGLWRLHMPEMAMGLRRSEDRLRLQVKTFLDLEFLCYFFEILALFFFFGWFFVFNVSVFCCCF